MNKERIQRIDMSIDRLTSIIAQCPIFEPHAEVGEVALGLAKLIEVRENIEEPSDQEETEKPSDYKIKVRLALDTSGVREELEKMSKYF